MNLNNVIELQALADSDCQPNQCWRNVSRKVKRDGGKPATGWAIGFRGEITELCPHVVWVSPQGNLLEITPHWILSEDGKVAEVVLRNGQPFLPDKQVRPGSHAIFWYEGPDKRYTEAIAFLELSSKHFRRRQKNASRRSLCRAYELIEQAQANPLAA